MGAADPLGAVDPAAAGEVLAADGETAGAGEEGVAAADGDAAVDGVAVVLGVEAGVEEAAAGAADMLGADVTGAELAGLAIDPDTAWSECMPGARWVEVASATPPAADAASSPVTSAAIASGRVRRG